MPRTPFTTLRRWLAATPTRPIRKARLGIFALEDRSVPAVTATFAGGTLTVQGTAADEIVDVILQLGQVKVKETVATIPNDVTINGGPVSVLAMTQLVVNADAGNDIVVVSPLIKKPAALNAGTGNDNMTGGGGNDVIDLDDDAIGDTADGGPGNDSITAGAGPDLLSGGTGNDTVNGGAGVNSISGNDGNDVLTGGSDIDDINGGNGNDLIDGGGGNDRLRGDDVLGKVPGNDTVTAGAGDDIMSGGAKNDQLDGGAGNDKIEGGSGNDILTGGPETAGMGDTDADSVYGGIGNDILTGGAGDDLLYGEAGVDIITGGAGMDVLSGGIGHDTMTGHGLAAPGSATDAANFDTYKDEFDLTKPVFGKAEPKDVAVTELGIQDALAGLASIANKQGDFNIATRIRYLGSGEYLVKLGPADDISDDAGNPNPFGWVPVTFNGTWTDNEPRPSAGERFLPATSITEQREFWTILLHRAAAQMLVPGYDPFLYSATVDPAMTNTGDVVDALTGRGATQFVVTPSPPAGFQFADIQAGLAAGQWFSARTGGVITVSGLSANQGYAITKAFLSNGITYYTLYNPSGRDRGPAAGLALDQVGIAKDDGFITITASDFYNNFVVGYKN